MENTNKPRPPVPCSPPQLSPSGRTGGAKNHTRTDGKTINRPHSENGILLGNSDARVAESFATLEPFTTDDNNSNGGLTLTPVLVLRPD